MKTTVTIATRDKLLGELLSFVIRQIDHDVLSLEQEELTALRIISTRRPDIALLDLSMPRFASADALKLIRSEVTQTRFIFFVADTDSRQMLQAFQMVPDGFLHADSTVFELTACLRAVVEGRSYVSDKVYECWSSLHRQNDVTLAIEQLTKREKEVLKLLAQELSTREIADRLFLSETTINNHKSRMGDKLGLKGHKAIKRLAIRASAWL